MRSFRSTRGVCRAIVMLAVVLAVGATGCGGESANESSSALADVRSAVAGLTGSQRKAKLAQLAAKEGGELTLYTSMTPGHDQAVADAFEDEFDISVAIYRSSAEGVAQRLLEEHRADFHGADVVDINGLELSTLSKRGILAPYRPDGVRDLVPKSSHGTWTATRFNIYVMSWNTRRVPASERPRTWEELADPRWKGKLGIEVGDFDWYARMHAYLIQNGRSEAEAERIFGAIASNSIVMRGHSLLEELLGAGELDVVVANYRHVVTDAIEEGAPIAWEPAVEPLISHPSGAGVVSGTRHPAAALLYMEWITSSGQELIRELGRDAARRDLVTAPGATVLQVDVERLVGDQTWPDRFDRLLRLGKSRPG